MFGLSEKRMKPKNAGFNLLHLEWKVRAETSKEGVGIATTIKDSTLSYNQPSLPFLFSSIAKDNPSFKLAILKAADMINGKSDGLPSLTELIKMKMDSEE